MEAHPASDAGSPLWMQYVCFEETGWHSHALLLGLTLFFLWCTHARARARTHTKQSSRTFSEAGEVPEDEGFGLDDPQGDHL